MDQIPLLSIFKLMRGRRTPVKTTITLEEFNKRYKQDPDEKQYLIGKFQLKDGSIVHADDLYYGKNVDFEYALATFQKGILVHLQMETTLTAEDALHSIGMTSLDKVRIQTYDNGEYGGGFEAIFDETFADENVSVFPNFS